MEVVTQQIPRRRVGQFVALNTPPVCLAQAVVRSRHADRPARGKIPRSVADGISPVSGAG
jgi:hypothetical protein